MMPFCSAFLNPSFSTVTAYVPTNKFGKTYVPELEVVVVAETPVAWFSAVTFASSILAWLLSAMVTRSVPSSRCARAALPNNMQSTPASAMTISLRIGFSPSAIELFCLHPTHLSAPLAARDEHGRCTQHSTLEIPFAIVFQ